MTLNHLVSSPLSRLDARVPEWIRQCEADQFPTEKDLRPEQLLSGVQFGCGLFVVVLLLRGGFPGQQTDSRHSPERSGTVAVPGDVQGTQFGHQTGEGTLLFVLCPHLFSSLEHDHRAKREYEFG